MSRLGGNSPSADTDKSNNLKGDPGVNGVTPNIGAGNNWFIDGVDTGVLAEGVTPTIGAGPDFNWFIGATDTGISAEGSDGADGTGIVNSIQAGAFIDSIDATDPTSPIINGTDQSATKIEISGFIQGAPTDAEKVATYVAAIALTLPASLTDSQAYAEVVSTAAATLDVQVNAVSKGSINFALGAAVATFTFAAPVVLAAGDRIQLIGQGTADDTLADISFTLRGDI